MKRACIALALAGCNALVGAGDYRTTDASTDATEPPSPITGTAVLRYQSDIGMTMAFDDLTKFEISAYVADETTTPPTITMFPGTGHADGTFEIPDVPAGEYYLRIADPTKSVVDNYQMSAHTVDLGYSVTGEYRDPPPQQQQLAMLSFTNMTPFLSSDAIGTYAATSGWEHRPMFVSGYPALHATQVSGVVDRAGQPRLDQEGLWVIHNRYFQDRRGYGYHYVFTVQQAAYVANLTETLGQTATISGSFIATTGTLITNLDVAAIRARAGPGADDYVTVAVNISPGFSSGGSFPISIYAAGGPVSRFSTFTPPNYFFADPFPSGWKRVRLGTWNRSYRSVESGEIGEFDALATVAGTFNEARLDTQLWWTSAIRANGGSVRAVIAPNVPLAIDWDPVELAGSYTVSIIAHDANPATADVIENVTTDATHLVIPTTRFPPGTRVSIEVKSSTAVGYRNQPRELPTDAHYARTGRGSLLVSSTCGDGVLQAPEACDTSGTSSTCDFDCTAVRCGDGFVNTDANEICDGTAECTSRCVPAVCGDGMQEGLEECDDTNTVNGDGCSANCRIEPGFCGIAGLNPGEECDDGNTVNTDGCTNACKNPRCGDAIVSTGETCDDGNDLEGDTCNNNCNGT